MKTKTLMSLATLATLPISQHLLAGNPHSKPNIIIIMADDLGYGDVSAYGSKTISTPNIDHLANGGVCLTNGHATSATSTPSRYGLLTGSYPWRNSRAKILPGDAPLLIDENGPTLPKMLQNAGYTTAAIGKWHLGMGHGKIDWNKQIKPDANDIGFDYTCLMAATVDRVPTVYVENGKVLGLDPNDPIEVNYYKNYPGEPTAITNPEMMTMRWSDGHQGTIVNGIPRIGYMKGGHTARWKDEKMAQDFLDKVYQFIDENKNDKKPFFLYYALHEPHVPRVPMTQFAGSSPMGPRGDVIKETDWCVGQVMRKLKEDHLLDNTIVIFTSDNGPVLDDGYQDKAVELAGNHDPMGGYRGGKYSLFEAGTRVPFFVYWKGHITPCTNDALVSQLDLFSSLAALVGEKTPDDLDSQNMLPAFMGKDKKGRRDMIVEADGRLALRSGDYEMIPPYRGPKRNKTTNELGNLPDYALFNVKKDPAEQNDLSAKYPKLLNKLTKRFTDLVGEHYKGKPNRQ